MNRIARLGLAVGLGALVATVGYAIDASGSEHDALGPGVVRVEVGIENSRFDLEPLRVQDGTLVEFGVPRRIVSPVIRSRARFGLPPG